LRVVVTHTDFRLYWPARLSALLAFAKTQGADLQVIEISGRGSPYAFAGTVQAPLDGWRCLFPDSAMEDLSPRQAGKALWNQLDALQPDVVMAGAIAFPSGATAVRWCARNGKGCVIFDDVRCKDVPRPFLVNWVKRRLYSHAHAMLLPAASHVPDYECWGFPRERLFFGLDVVDNTFFREHADRVRLGGPKKRLDLGIPRLYFLGVGRLIDKKNWATLIQAFAHWQSTGKAEPWSLVLAGDGPMRTALEASIPEAVKDHVHFVGFKTLEEICAYYAFAEALVLPSSHGETWGLVVNEAMASGLPVIVSRECGCAKTLIHEGVNGWTLDPYSTGDLAGKLAMMAEKGNAERKQMGAASQEIIADWDLGRFVQGAWNAIRYASEAHKRRANLFDSLILSLWHGRYRPL